MSTHSGSGRARSANFSPEEKIALFRIIEKYKLILENKKTDAVSNKEKDQTWDKITAEFNATNPQTTARSKDSLKRFYENKKKELRRKVANQKMNVKGTGGGPPPLDEVTNRADDLLLSIINKKTVFGLNSPAGGDVDSEEEENQHQGNANDIEITYDYEDTDDYLTLKPSDVASTNKEVLSNHTFNTTWDKYKGADLQQPISTPLKRKIVEDSAEPNEEPVNKTRQTPKLGNSRRRPAVTVRALTSSDVASKYNELLDKRLQLIEISKDKVQQEIAQNGEKHDKEMALLDIQLEVKKEKLKRIRNSSLNYI